MVIPKKLKIGAHLFRIELKPLSSDLGETKTGERLIIIDSDAHQTIQEATLIHEVFHVLNPTIDSSTLGHAFLDSLCEQFYQVLKDNHLLK